MFVDELSNSERRYFWLDHLLDPMDVKGRSGDSDFDEENEFPVTKVVLSKHGVGYFERK